MITSGKRGAMVLAFAIAALVAVGVPTFAASDTGDRLQDRTQLQDRVELQDPAQDRVRLHDSDAVFDQDRDQIQDRDRLLDGGQDRDQDRDRDRDRDRDCVPVTSPGNGATTDSPATVRTQSWERATTQTEAQTQQRERTGGG